MNTIVQFPTNETVKTRTESGEVNAIYTDYAGNEQEFFHVARHPISGPFGEIENKKGLFVGKRNVNIVSDNYAVHQPLDIFRTFERIAQKTDLEINRVITNPHNGGLMISAKYAETKIVGEDHDVNLTFYTSHCGKYRTFLTMDLLRLACFNQTPALYKNQSRFLFAEKHYKNALRLELVEELLTHLPESIEAYNEKAEYLRSMKMTAPKFQKLFAEHYNLKKEQKQYESKMRKAKEIFLHAKGQEQLENSAYKAFNAVTFMNTHELKNSAMKEEGIITRASNDSLKFMDRLLAA